MNKIKYLILNVVILTVAIAAIGCTVESLDQDKTLWDNTEGAYKVDYIVTEATGGMISMVEKYCLPGVDIKFNGSKYQLLFCMNSRKLATPSLQVGDEIVYFVEQDGSTDDNVMYMIELKSAEATGNYTLKTKVIKMGMKVDFTISLDTVNAVLI